MLWCRWPWILSVRRISEADQAVDDMVQISRTCVALSRGICHCVGHFIRQSFVSCLCLYSILYD